jgi:hypothetical protein
VNFHIAAHRKCEPAAADDDVMVCRSQVPTEGPCPVWSTAEDDDDDPAPIGGDSMQQSADSVAAVPEAIISHRSLRGL